MDSQKNQPATPSNPQKDSFKDDRRTDEQRGHSSDANPRTRTDATDYSQGSPGNRQPGQGQSGNQGERGAANRPEGDASRQKSDTEREQD